MTTDSHSFHSAFIAFLGRPNCGKSTLLNTILGENLSIVSPIPQTTRRNIKGIYTDEHYQLIFVDTPGIHRGKHEFNKAMYQESTSVLSDSGIDIVCYVIDLSRKTGDEESQIIHLVTSVSIPACIIFNKKDLCPEYEQYISDLFLRYPRLSSYPFVSLSAIQPQAREIFIQCIKPMVPCGPLYYADDEITDSDLRFFASEYIRKEIIENTYEEIPHASFVEILDYKESDERHTVDAVIHVETQGQKGILIGNAGKTVKRIQYGAQKQLKHLTGIPATIRCHVKVTPKWRDNERFLRSFGMQIKQGKRK